MKNQDLLAINPSLAAVQKQFETWRRTRSKKGAIPGRLWSDAISLSSRYTLSEIAATLRLNYSDLRRRVMNRASADECAAPFVELNIHEMRNTSHCTIELEDRLGRRMKMCSSGSRVIDPLELITAFFGR